MKLESEEKIDKSRIKSLFTNFLLLIWLLFADSLLFCLFCGKGRSSPSSVTINEIICH